MGLGNSGRISQRRQRKDKEMRFGTWTRDEEACRRSRKMEGVCRGPPNAVRHHGEEKEEEIKNETHKFLYHIFKLSNSV
jgi:hypothetical protein